MGTSEYIDFNEDNINKEDLKEADKNCGKCRGIGIDHYGNPCICRYQ